MLLFAAGSTAMASVQALPVDPAVHSAVPWLLLARILLLAGFLFTSVLAFKIPGTGLPEIGAIFLLGALLVPAFIRGEAQWYELVCVAAGLLLIGIELFVIPGFGATGVIGILSLAIGLLLIFLPAASPTHSLTLIDLRNALIILVGGSSLGLVSFAWISHRLPSGWGTNKLVLRETNAVAMPAQCWPHVGDVGVAFTDLRPGGTVQLNDPAGTPRRVDVVSKRGFVSSGSKVIVTEVVGTVISVKLHQEALTAPANSSGSAAGSYYS